MINEQDRRAKNVALTDAGLKTWDSLQDDFFNFYGQALNTLAFDDVVTLIHLLNKVNDGLKSIQIAQKNTASDVWLNIEDKTSGIKKMSLSRLIFLLLDQLI